MKYEHFLGLSLSFFVLWIFGFVITLLVPVISPLFRTIYILIGVLFSLFAFLALWLRRRLENLRSNLDFVERKYRTLFDNLEEALVVCDPTGKVVEWNRRAEEIFGFKKAEIIGREYPFSPEGGKMRLQDIRDGCIKREERVDRIAKDGSSKTLLVTTLPLFDRERSYRGFVEISTDMREGLGGKEPLQDVERMALFAEIAPGLAHQLNTPLASIQLMAEMLDQEAESPEIRREMVKIEKQVSYCKSIVEKLMRLSRRPESKKVPLVFCDLLEDLVNFYGKELERKNIRISFPSSSSRLCPECVIRADPEGLSHVFLNLFSNAIDAMPTGGEIEIACEKVDNWLSITFKDTGTGIREEDLPRIFEPFFTTKEAGKGTGLGLSIVKRIVEEHGGDVRVRSKVGQGAEFVVRFPVDASEGRGE